MLCARCTEISTTIVSWPSGVDSALRSHLRHKWCIACSSAAGSAPQHHQGSESQHSERQIVFELRDGVDREVGRGVQQQGRAGRTETARQRHRHDRVGVAQPGRDNTGLPSSCSGQRFRPERPVGGGVHPGTNNMFKVPKPFLEHIILACAPTMVDNSQKIKKAPKLGPHRLFNLAALADQGTVVNAKKAAYGHISQNRMKKSTSTSSAPSFSTRATSTGPSATSSVSCRAGRRLTLAFGGTRHCSSTTAGPRFR